MQGNVTTVFGRSDGHVKTSQAIRVCFISPLGYGLYQPDSNLPFGGAEVQFFLLSKALAEEPSFEVSVLTTVQTDSGTERHDRIALFRRHGKDQLVASFAALCRHPIRVVRGYLSAFSEMLRLFRKINADVYLHSGAGTEVGAYALICRLLRRRFVFVVSSIADVCQVYGRVEGVLKWLYPLGVWLADEVVCRTRDQQEALRSRYHRTGALIRTGHPLRHDSTIERAIVLWVGRIHPLKQPSMFLDLAERLPAERCVMVGMRDRTHGELWHQVRERAIRLPNVQWYENVPLSSVDSHFAEAKLFVSTSEYEGFPNTFVQAAAHGVPIVSWRVDPDRVLSEHRIGICAGGSFERLLSSARMLCADDHQRREMGSRAKTYARECHDLNKRAAEFKCLLRRLVGPR